MQTYVTYADQKVLITIALVVISSSFIISSSSCCFSPFSLPPQVLLVFPFRTLLASIVPHSPSSTIVVVVVLSSPSSCQWQWLFLLCLVNNLLLTCRSKSFALLPFFRSPTSCVFVFVPHFFWIVAFFSPLLNAALLPLSLKVHLPFFHFH